MPLAGLFTSPHLLEVTERVRVCGKPLSKECFRAYFFQVWDKLQASAEEGADGPMAVADMPTYFHLLTLVGLLLCSCFFSRLGVTVNFFDDVGSGALGEEAGGLYVHKIRLFGN